MWSQGSVTDHRRLPGTALALNIGRPIPFVTGPTTHHEVWRPGITGTYGTYPPGCLGGRPPEGLARFQGRQRPQGVLRLLGPLLWARSAPFVAAALVLVVTSHRDPPVRRRGR